MRRREVRLDLNDDYSFSKLLFNTIFMRFISEYIKLLMIIIEKRQKDQ